MIDIHVTDGVVDLHLGGEDVDVHLGGEAVEVVVTQEGRRGPAGEGGATANHTQSSPSAAWTFNHNLGFRPNCTVLDTGGGEMEALVIHVNVNQLMIYFTSPQVGTARCI